MIYSLARPEGCVEAASCAQMGIQETGDQTMYLSGALWLLGFGLYVWIYLPILAFRNSAGD